MSTISIWNYSIPLDWLSEPEANYLRSLPAILPTVDWVCSELDSVWYGFNLDNHRELALQPIGAYYGHPVWLMNGIFSAQDPVSSLHRSAIAQYLKNLSVKVVADYGGGFGELARKIVHANADTQVFVVEPYPSNVGVEQLRNESQIKIVPNLSGGMYEVIVAQDVLEHVEDPIKLASEIATAVRIGGRIIFANCFFPVIQCHLPSTFHLRHTFPLVMKALGLRFVGRVVGSEHAQVYERVGSINLNIARRAEILSRLVGPGFNHVHMFLSHIKGLVLRLYK
jgi:2-polyprenyl-6-hydroxyphenyl methylase/3-demethylubiquinone-9 3-methyltransferase